MITSPLLLFFFLLLHFTYVFAFVIECQFVKMEWKMGMKNRKVKRIGRAIHSDYHNMQYAICNHKFNDVFNVKIDGMLMQTPFHGQ